MKFPLEEGDGVLIRGFYVWSEYTALCSGKRPIPMRGEVQRASLGLVECVDQSDWLL